MSDLETLIKNLRSEKLRVTALRRALLEILLNSKTPLSAGELLISLSKRRIKSHKTSLYRQLDALEKSKIIVETRLGENKRRFEILPESHQHHLICVDCGSIANTVSEGDLDSLERKIYQERKFKTINHSLEFFGLCIKCNNSK